MAMNYIGGTTTDSDFERLILNPQLQSKIGPAWRLFLLIYYNSDSRGFLKLTHTQIARQLDVNHWTLRYWRRFLCEQRIVDSIANSRHVFFYLQEPWISSKKNSTNEYAKHST